MHPQRSGGQRAARRFSRAHHMIARLQWPSRVRTAAHWLCGHCGAAYHVAPRAGAAADITTTLAIVAFILTAAVFGVAVWRALRLRPEEKDHLAITKNIYNLTPNRKYIIVSHDAESCVKMKFNHNKQNCSSHLQQVLTSS